MGAQAEQLAKEPQTEQCGCSNHHQPQPLIFFQRVPSPPEFAQPGLSRANDSHPQREGTNLGVFVLVWLVLSWCDATKLGVFDLCKFDLLKRGCADSGGLELADSSSGRRCSRTHKSQIASDLKLQNPNHKDFLKSLSWPAQIALSNRRFVV